MTDFSTDPGIEAASAENSGEQHTGDVNWEERYRTEVQDRIKERERYKPIAQTFNNLHPDDSRAIQEFLSAFAAGDTETATRWMIDNAKALAGDRFNDYVSPQAQSFITNQVVAEAQQDGLSPQDVEKLVEQRLDQYQHTLQSWDQFPTPSIDHQPPRQQHHQLAHQQQQRHL